MKPGNLSFLIFCAGLLFVASIAMADRIPINGPTPITQSGSYYVSTSFSASGIAIYITVDNVSVDLDGQVITCSSQKLDCIRSVGKNTTITNGKVVGGLCGISVLGAAEAVRIENVVVQSDSGICVDENKSTSPTRAFIKNNLINAGDTGIRLVNVTGGEVKGNSIRGGVKGILGLQIQATLIMENTVHHCDSVGIHMLDSDNNQFSNNIVVQSARGIVSLGDGNRILDNIFSDNIGTSGSEVGLHVLGGDYNEVKGNLCTGNSFIGIDIDGNGNVYSGNRSRDNGTLNYSIVQGNTDAGDNY